MSLVVDDCLLFILFLPILFFFFFFNDTATTEIYTLSLHDALPISSSASSRATADASGPRRKSERERNSSLRCPDRKSTRLNSSHLVISYAVFCLKKKKKITTNRYTTTMFAREHATRSCQISDCLGG